MDKLCEAQGKIAKILADLEVETNSLVTGISTVAMEVTGLYSERPEHRRHIDIALDRRPGQEWG